MCINKITDKLNLEVEKLVKISTLLKDLQSYYFISPACKTKITIYQEMIENNAVSEEEISD